ncbi:uncharacterized protein SPSK_07830 [Sporothrix schenckii 1099-18]|uniref:Spherulin-4 n=2 Tax=Sporothrix schenckii TaxID=29908 RepID=U7PYD0_SPOS1|nr:uncharacterized protein SPSK_07830 [Sporothrix schenckii 1099-18]ERT00664.1 hypothetical protein HMPREF1624_01894 [Sporothrix schenckii ATCC 58251]KJR87731.1 hypothetical protein SPSK_07830 [Sporothrix schenckii 1099-18]
MVAYTRALAGAVGLLVPLYEYPTGTTATADWTALIAAIDAHPQLPFYVVINDANGPPYSPNPPASIPDWAQWIDALNTRSNAKTIGYIYTSRSTRAYSDLTAAVDQYASWTTSAGFTTNASRYDIHIDGIFFDEIDTVPAKLTNNTQLTTYAKTAFAGRGGPVVLNPGTLVQAGSESLFDLADSILQIETCYTNTTGATDPGGIVRCPTGGYAPFTPALATTVGDAARSAKSSIVVHDFYETWSPFAPASLSALQTDIAAVVQQGVHSFYFTVYGYTTDFTASPASITQVADYAAQLQGLA